MRLKEFEKKYTTGQEVDVCCDLVMRGGKTQVVSIPGEKFEAPLGEFIRDYYTHLSMSPLKRFFLGIPKWEWESVEKKFRQKLNIINLTWDDVPNRF